MAVKDIHVLESQALQALIQAGQEIFAGTAVAVGTGPQVVSRLGRDNEFVAAALEILSQNATESLFRGSGRRAVIVRQVEMGNAQIEGRLHQRARVSERVRGAEIVPYPQREGRQLQAAATAAAVAAACSCRPSLWGYGTISAPRTRSETRARWCRRPSIWALPISTWRTITALRPDPRKRLSVAFCDRISRAAATNSLSRPRRDTTCGPVPTATAVPANISWPAWIRA